MNSEVRDNFLLALREPQASSELLLSMLAEIENYQPNLLQDFSSEPSLVYDKLCWTASYFDRHMGVVHFNFSRKRIEHLIKVREYLCHLGVKGFVAAPKSSVIDIKSDSVMPMSYIPSLHLKKFVIEGDLHTIRTALRMELNDNRLSGTDLCSALKWTKEEVPGLFENYEEKAFARNRKFDQLLWTSHYYDTQIVYLKTNFSEERLLHLIEVREHLRQQGVEGFAAVAPRQQSKPGNPRIETAQSQSMQSQTKRASHDNPERNPVFAAAIMLGGALAALAVLLIALVN